MRRVVSLAVIVLSVVLVFARPGGALIVEQQVTPEYLKAHSKRWSVKAEKRDEGMLHFTIGRSLTQVKYLVSRMVLKQGGKKLADISTPTFAQKGVIRFHIAVSPAHLAEAEYELSESFVAGPETDPVPIPGTIIYKFSLKDFVE